jgi:hypothetical protein
LKKFKTIFKRLNGKGTVVLKAPSGETEIERYGETEIERFGETEIERFGETEIERFGETEIERFGETEIERYGESETEIERFGETEIERYGETEIERFGETEIERFGETEIERFGETEIERVVRKSELEQNSTEQVLRRPNSASHGTPAGASLRKVAIPTKYSNQIHQSGHTKPNIQTKFPKTGKWTINF